VGARVHWSAIFCPWVPDLALRAIRERELRGLMYG